MSRDGASGEIPDGSSVIGVRPKVLRVVGLATFANPGASYKEARTRTEYWRPARIQGDSVKLKNMSAGSSSVLIYRSVNRKRPRAIVMKCAHTSMNTVPFWLSPLQYWAG